MPKNDGSPTIYERAKARDMAELNDGTLTLHDASIMRGQAATRASEANARKQAQSRVVANERARAAKIFAHPNVKNGTAIQLANFLVTQTDMSPDEACAALDQAHAGDPEKVHHAGGYEAGREAATRLLHPIEADRHAKQALNDQAFAEANFGRVSVDRRSDRQKQMDEDIANIAQRAGRGDHEDEDDTDKLKALGFGGGAQLEQSAYAAGAASASRLLGKSPSGSAGYPATTAARPASAPPSAGRQPAATSLSSPDASYSEGRASALKLLSDTSAVRSEADNEIRQRFAEQQRERARE
jgi:hypothetical protein